MKWTAHPKRWTGPLIPRDGQEMDKEDRKHYTHLKRRASFDVARNVRQALSDMLAPLTQKHYCLHTTLYLIYT